MTAVGGVECRNVAARYGKKNVLGGISGTIPAGCVTFLLGPNGSGKSTLLRVLGGILPFEGLVLAGGTDIRHMAPRARGRRIGSVSQLTGANFPFTVEEVVAMGRFPHRTFSWPWDGGERRRRDRESVRRAAASMDIGPLMDRRFPSLSGGERQRVMVAQLLVQDPDIMLLDEPSSALDPRHTVALFRMLRKAADSGKTVVVAAHDINLAAKFGDSVWILEEGRVHSSGPVDLILTGDILASVYGISFAPLWESPSPRGEGSERRKVLWHAL